MRYTVRAGIGGAALLATLAGWSEPVIGEPPAKGIALSPIGVYRTGLFDEGAVEISAFDPETKRAFLTFAARPRLDVVDLTDPAAPVLVGTIDLTPWGAGAHATSVAVHDGVLAIAVPQGEDDTGPGKALFFDTDGILLSEVTVGALPDMIVFSPNGQLVLTANEGQPNQPYTFDPEGSVSVIDVSGGAATLTDADVTDVGFSAFNGAALDPSIRIFGPGATVAEDLEPEYISNLARLEDCVGDAAGEQRHRDDRPEVEGRDATDRPRLQGPLEDRERPGRQPRRQADRDCAAARVGHVSARRHRGVPVAQHDLPGDCQRGRRAGVRRTECGGRGVGGDRGYRARSGGVSQCRDAEESHARRRPPEGHRVQRRHRRRWRLRSPFHVRRAIVLDLVRRGGAALRQRRLARAADGSGVPGQLQRQQREPDDGRSQ